MRYRWLIIRGSLKHRPFTAHCSRCERRRWIEEIVAGCGWCDRCWQYYCDHDPAIGGDGKW